MKRLLSIIFIIGSLGTFSQPLVLTKAAFDPVIGDSSKTYVIDTSAYSAGLNVSLTGSNTTWNYSGLVALSASLTSAYLDPTSVPSASAYPGCTIAEKQGSIYSFFKSVSSPTDQLEFMGVYSTSLVLNFSNTGIIMKYPLSFGNSFTDTYSGSFTYSTSGNASGTGTITADGTGTLIIPSGTLDNVLRVKSSQATNFSIGGFPAGSMKQTLYSFYHSSQKFPILSINYQTLTAFGSSTITAEVTGNKNNFVVGMKENVLNERSAVLYPNPANSQIHIRTDAALTPLGIKIIDQIGNTVYDGKFSENINIEAFSSGLYQVILQTEKGIVKKKFICQN